MARNELEQLDLPAVSGSPSIIRDIVSWCDPERSGEVARRYAGVADEDIGVGDTRVEAANQASTFGSASGGVTTSSTTDGAVPLRYIGEPEGDSLLAAASSLDSALSLVDEPLPFSDLGDKAVLSGAAERRSLAELCAAKNAAQKRRASNERFMASRRAPRRPPQRLQSPASSTASTFLAAFGRSEGGAERASQRRASGSRDRASHPGSRASSTRSRERGQGQGLSKPRLPSRPAFGSRSVAHGQDVYLLQKRAAELPAPGQYYGKRGRRGSFGKKVSGGRFNLSKPKTELDWVEYRAKDLPAPGTGQPEMGFSTFNSTRGGKISETTSKGMIDQHVYEKRGLPAPGAGQPKGGFSSLHALNRAGGRFNASNPKSDIEWQMYKASTLPAPGDGQPMGGFSTLATSGGQFNMSKPKNYIDQHVHNKKDMPSPGVNQPKGGFSTLSKSGGGFNMSNPKSDIEWQIYNASKLPAPGEGQPAGGFDTMTQKTHNKFHAGEQERAKLQGQALLRQTIKTKLIGQMRMFGLNKLQSKLQADDC